MNTIKTFYLRFYKNRTMTPKVFKKCCNLNHLDSCIICNNCFIQSFYINLSLEEFHKLDFLLVSLFNVRFHCFNFLHSCSTASYVAMQLRIPLQDLTCFKQLHTSCKTFAVNVATYTQLHSRNKYRVIWKLCLDIKTDPSTL